MKHKRFLLFLVAAVAILLLAACQPEVVTETITETVIEEVEVTRVVEGEVITEVQEVEVEVTRVIEVEVEAPAAEAPAEEAAPTGPVAGGTLTLSLGPDFVTFHPYWDVTNRNFKPTFFDPPIRIGDDGQFEPWLAESWEISDDGLTITLHLREGVMFHNGREMTAEDVVWSVDYARDEEYGHHLSDRFGTCTGAAALDNYTVEIYYDKVAHSALDGLARMYIFPQEAVEDIETTPVGTGPFKLGEWVPGDHLTAIKFDDYWQEGLPYLDEIIIKPIPDAQSRMVNLLAKSIDGLWEVPQADISLLGQSEGIVVGQSAPGFGFYAFIMNINEPPFDNQLVRQAMNYAIDREKINQLAFHGEGMTTVIPYTDASWAYPEDLANYYTHDPEKAKELLTEAGYPDGFEVQMVIRGAGGPHLDQAQVYQQDLAAVGIDVEILPTELPQYWPILINSEFVIVSHATGEATVDPSGQFEGAACCRPFRNFFGILDDDTWFPEYEAIVSQAATEMEQETRAALYHDALEILLEQGWTIPTVWRQEAYAYHDYVMDFRTDMDGLIWLGETWLSE
ncbi:MAG: ABC transporter substrate-binding protein [Chloroflexi bacterium]|nr:ABC transporter substrate-binding protein [Chloroflexota bacterium]